MRSELLSQPVVTIDGIDFMPEDKVELLAGAEEPDEKNPQYEVIYSVMAMNTPLPSAWEGAIEPRKKTQEMELLLDYCVSPLLMHAGKQ